VKTMEHLDAARRDVDSKFQSYRETGSFPEGEDPTPHFIATFDISGHDANLLGIQRAGQLYATMKGIDPNQLQWDNLDEEAVELISGMAALWLDGLMIGTTMERNE
jgi:hypothetical protein